MSVQNTTCCGLMEFYGFAWHRTFKSVIKEIKRNIVHSRKFVLFTDVKHPLKTKGVNGQNFYKFIQDNKLGDVVKTKVKENRNSGNKLVCYIWDFDRKVINAFLSKK